MELKILDPRAKIPELGTEGAAAFDLCAVLDDPVILYPGMTWKVHTGIAVHIADPGLVGVIAPRSGLGSKQGIVLANLVGVVDSDYQGEVMVVLWNRGRDMVSIRNGDRIAQMMFMPVVRPTFTVVEEFSNGTDRGTGGFGSTGIGVLAETVQLADVLDDAECEYDACGRPI